MPYNYRSLKKHISLKHPEKLDDFEVGWEKLGRELQQKWIKRGIAPAGLPYGQNRAEKFISWSHVLNGELKDTHPNLRTLSTGFAAWICKKLDHQGSFFEIPPLSGFPDKSRYDMIVKHLFRSGATDAMFKLRREMDVRYNVGLVAANAMLATEVEKLIERFKEDIEENGFDNVRKYFPHVFPQGK